MSNQVFQQPQAQPGMSASKSRNPKNLPVGPNGRQWSFDLCDCCSEAGTCILACFCPCIVYGKNKHRYDHLSAHGTAHPEEGGGCCSGDCCLHACLFHCGLAWILQMSNRSGMRQRYHVDGSCCGDCCTAFFCTPCELTQEQRELALEEHCIERQGVLAY